MWMRALIGWLVNVVTLFQVLFGLRVLWRIGRTLKGHAIQGVIFKKSIRH